MNGQTEKKKDDNRDTAVVRGYKDSVFRKLFNDRENAVELYNGLFGTDYGPDTPLDFNTIEEVIFKTIKNDLAFTIAGRFIVLVEHQSTINKNMAIRDLIYFATIVQKMIGNRDIYKESAMEIPRPSFIVFYNGTREMPDMEELRLSDNFMGEDGEISLQLVVKVYNINNGRNAELLERCRTLKEYSRFVEIVRARAEEGPLTETVMQEVFDYCLDKGILAEFLRKYGMEVINMLFKELTEEEAREMSRQDGIELGEQIGKEKGKAEGKAEDIIDLLSELGDVPDDLKENIFAQSDLEILKHWLKLAARAESIGEFQNHIM